MAKVRADINENKIMINKSKVGTLERLIKLADFR